VTETISSSPHILNKPKKEMNMNDRLNGKIYETGDYDNWYVLDTNTLQQYPIAPEYQNNNYYREIVTFELKDGIAVNIQMVSSKEVVRMIVEKIIVEEY
jgi:hypothetical protein